MTSKQRDITIEVNGGEEEEANAAAERKADEEGDGAGSGAEEGGRRRGDRNGGESNAKPADFMKHRAITDDPEVLRMPLSELVVAKVERFCRQRVPPEALHQVRLEVEVNRNAITIVERRAPWRADYGPEWSRFPIARFRYTAPTGLWTLYWRDRNLRFHRYDLLVPAASIDEILDEIARDPTSIFWG